MSEASEPAKGLTERQVAQLAKEAAKAPIAQTVQGISSTEGRVYVREGKVIVVPEPPPNTD